MAIRPDPTRPDRWGRPPACAFWLGSAIAVVRRPSRGLMCLSHRDAGREVGRGGGGTAVPMTPSRDPRNTPLAAEPRWRLADPGLPGTSLRQRIYHQCRSAALTCVVFGPGPVEECVAETARTVPALHRSLADEHGFGLLDGYRLTWAAVHGPSGSAVLFFPGNGDLDLLLRQVTDRLPALRPPWKWTLEIRDGDWQQSVARVLDRARAVPAWDLGGAVDARRVDGIPGGDQAPLASER